MNKRPWSCLTIAAVLPVLAGVTAAAASTAKPPSIAVVYFSGSAGNYTLTISGSGFGAPAVALPFTGDAPNFRVGDNAQLGHGEWGYTGDANTLRYLVWTNTEIRVGGLGAAPGDALVIALWNKANGLGATWGGSVPLGSPSTPAISSVTFSDSGASLGMVVKGNGFGPAPRSLPFTGDLNWFFFQDFRAHCGGGSSLFSAGGNYFGVHAGDSVKLVYHSWSDHKIVISGFGGAYGTGCASERTGDPVVISVWNTGATSDTGLQTAWAGRT